MSFARQDSPKKFFTLKEASSVLSVPVETLLEWNENRILIPTITQAGEVRYTEEQIEQFLTIRKLIQQDKVSTEVVSNSPQANFFAAEKQGGFQVESARKNFYVEEIKAKKMGHQKSGVEKKSPARNISVLAAIIALLVVGTLFGMQGGSRSGLGNQRVSQAAAPNVGSSDKTSRLNLSQKTSLPSPIQLSKETALNKSLHSEGENPLAEKIKALKDLYAKNAVVKDSLNQAQFVLDRKQTTKSISNSVNDSDIEQARASNASSFAVLASRTFGNQISDDLAFDSRGNIKGQAQDTLTEAIGGVGPVGGIGDPSRLVSLDPKAQVMFLTIGFLMFLFVFQNKLAYIIKDPKTIQNQPFYGEVTSEQIIEVDQKTDGTVLLYIQGKEYKISKPELYSESDQFIERLMSLARNTKEIEYDTLKDTETKFTTPLSRLVTRLGFVGTKRDLFFPRTSKDRVLFRRYLTIQDLNDMNLKVDQLVQELTVPS